MFFCLDLMKDSKLAHYQALLFVPYSMNNGSVARKKTYYCCYNPVILYPNVDHDQGSIAKPR